MKLQKVVLSAVAAFALAATATSASAGGSIKDGPDKGSGGAFGELTGTYIVDAGNNDWTLFGPAIVPGMSQGGLGDGFVGRAMVGYRVGIWDVALAAQLGVLGNGDPSKGGGQFATLEADYRAFDAMIGYNTRVGSAKTRLAVGVRFAEWDNTVNPGSGRAVLHNWDGVGPRAEVSTSVPLSGPWSLQLGAGVSYLWGDIKTTGTGGWICTDCKKTDANSTNVDGSVGIGLQFAPAGTLVLGYRVEYWSDVNVAITDNTNIGGNRGTSDHLIHGPFVSLKFGN